MPTVFDVDHAVVGHLRADIAVAHRRNRQRDERVERLERQCRALNPRNLVREVVAHLGKQSLLQPHRLFVRAEHRFLDLVQLRRGVALAVGERLLARIAVGHLIVVRLGDLDVIAKDLVVLDFEVLDFGQLALLRLEVRNPLLAVLRRAAQLVQLRAVPLADVRAVVHEQRRVRIDGAREQVHHVVKRRQLAEQVAKQTRRPDSRQRIVNGGHMGKRLAQREAVLRVDGSVGNAAEQALDVVDVHERLAQHIDGHHRAGERLHGVKPRVDFLADSQRLLDEAAQHPRAHRRGRVIENPQQRALPAARAHALRQFEIAPGCVVEHHVAAVVVFADGVHVLERVLLRLLQIAHQRAGRADAQLHGADAVGIQRLYMKVRQQRRLRTRILVGNRLAQGDGQIACALGQLRVGDDLLGRNARQLVLQALVRVRNFIDEELTRRYVREGDARAATVEAHAEQIAVLALVEHRLLDDRSRRHHTDDVALYQPLGRGGVLHLLADGDLVALLDQPVDVGLSAVEGHAAHRRALLQTAAFPRQRQLQLAGDELRVVKKHLIEVAQTEEEDHTGVFLLHLHVLTHHRGHTRHDSASVVSLILCAISGSRRTRCSCQSSRRFPAHRR